MWGSLLLQVDPVSLNASQRIHLVNTVSEYLHLQQEPISLFSNTKALSHIRVCGPSNLKERDLEGDATIRKITELIWRVGCMPKQVLCPQGTFVLESDNLAKQLDVPVCGLRILRTVEAFKKVKRDLRDQPSSHSLSLPTLTGTAKTQGYVTSMQNTKEQMNSRVFNVLQYFSMTKIPSLSNDRSESLSLSFEHITPLLLGPSAYTGSPTVMTTDLQRLPTSLTSGPDLEAPETYGYSHSESSRQAHMKSQGKSTAATGLGVNGVR